MPDPLIETAHGVARCVYDARSPVTVREIAQRARSALAAR
jgi:hypothetical protein